MAEDEVSTILRDYRRIAVVGLSPEPTRHSHQVASYLLSQGYEVIPVNPNAQEVLGRKSYPSLSAVPGKIEVVSVLRRAEEAMPIVEEAIRIGARAIWPQEGIVSEAAAARARQAGLLVVMDRCMLKEHRRLDQGK